MTRLLRLPQVAERLGVSLRSARRWAAEARFPVVRLGRTVRVAEADLERYIASRRRDADPGPYDDAA